MTKRTFGTRRKHKNYKKKTLRNKKFRGGDGEDCPICHTLLENEPTITTPCNHTFHRRCLHTWCNSPITHTYSNPFVRCPLCNQNINATCTVLNQDAVNQPPVIQPTVNQAYVWPLEYSGDLIPENQWISAGFSPILNNPEWRIMQYNLWKTIPNPDPRITRYVRTIHLSNSDLQNDDISRICNSFPNLVLLEVGHNNITEIPNTIGNLTELTFIDLADNRITHLPNSMGNLKKLKTVYLADNNIPVEDIVAMFADPYWNDKQVTIEADNINAVNDDLPYKFKINYENNLASDRPGTIPLTAGFRKRKSRKTRRKRSTIRR